MKNFKENLIVFTSLFTSFATIFCCALPIIFVFLGFGAVFAAISNDFPVINFLAEQSIVLFGISFVLLVISGYLIFIRNQFCSVDKDKALLCMKAKKINKIVWVFSFIIFLLGFFFKYILIKLV